MLLKCQLLVRSDSTDQLWCVADLGQSLILSGIYKRKITSLHVTRSRSFIFVSETTRLKGQSAEVTDSSTAAGNRSSFSRSLSFIHIPILHCLTPQAKSFFPSFIPGGRSKMSTPARKRLMRDFKRLQNDPPAGISGAPVDNNIMLWNAVIFGPDDTPWDGGTFKLTLQFSEDYPNKPPTVRFISRMFHPNIYADGSICLDILQNQWSPIYDVAAILTSIQSLLCDPNPNSPANSEAARMFSENKREYNRKVREIVEQSWTAD
ncbi:hypothetical protein L1887_36613 [Cichorium endivia]|nr:hypothetical protein L1887_36613 [Cichorium endivia]